MSFVTVSAVFFFFMWFGACDFRLGWCLRFGPAGDSAISLGVYLFDLVHDFGCMVCLLC